MTTAQFNEVVSNFSFYKGRQVEFKYFIPSANRHGIAKGFIRGIGKLCNEGCLIIGDGSRKHAIYHEYIKL